MAARKQGQIKVEYDGTIPAELREHLDAVGGIRVEAERTLTLVTENPETLLNQIIRYLADEHMSVRRVELRRAQAA